MPCTVNGLTAGEQMADRTNRLLHFSFLGGFVVWQGDTAVSLDTPSYQSLLAYLALHPQQAHSRRLLAFQFWPDSTEAQARTNLRKAIYTLRQSLSDANRFLEATRQTLRWRADAPCVVDVSLFETAVAQSQQSSAVNEQQSYMEQAVAVYQGDFMPGHYDEWVLAYREKLRSQYLAALEQLLLEHERQREYAAAIGYARQLLREDPLHEAAYRRLMRLQSLDGNAAGALRTYHVCCTRLQRELGVDPSPVTKEVYERLLRVEAPPIPMALARLPLVGREQAWQMLQNRWKRCRNGQPSVVMLSGEAGIGKTRLAEEMVDWAERQGIMAMTAVCYPSEKQLAYAPIAKWLRSECMQSTYDHLEQRHLVECSRLLPELNSQHPNLPPPSPLRESWQRQHFFSTLAQTLLALRQPFLMYLDDLPWCDHDSLEFLLFLLQYDPQSRFLLLTTARSEEILPEHALIPWQQQLDRSDRLTRITLQRLDLENSAQLAGHVLRQTLDPGQAKLLFAETEGNPLFVVEVARVGLPDQVHASFSSLLPRKIQAIIENRLGTLSQPAMELAQLASVIGRAFTFNLLNYAWIHDEELLVRSLDEMWQHRIIRERDAKAYDFSHNKIRQVVYESLSYSRRRQLHKRVWRALELLHADNLDPISGQIAAHCEAAGYDQEAIAYYQRAAQVAQAVYANRDTVKYLQRAVGLLFQVEVDSQQQIEIYEQLGDVFLTIGRYEEAEEALATAIDFTDKPVIQSRINRKIANTWQLRRQYDKAFDTWQTAEKRLKLLSRNWSQEYWQEWLWIQLDKSWILYWTDRLKDLECLLEEIHPIAKENGTPSQQGLYYQRLVMLSLRRDRYVLPDETIEYARESFTIIQESGTLSQMAFSQFVLGHALNWHGWEGDLIEAEYHIKAALKLAEQIGDVVLQERCLIHLCTNFLRQGNSDAIEPCLTQAMAIAGKANILEYVAVGESLKAWYAWRIHDYVESKQFGEHALELVNDLPFVWPAKFVAVWPLISIALMHNEIEKAVEYAQMLLDPGQTRLRDELTAVMQQAITAWEGSQPDAARTKLKQALQLAQIYHYL